MIPSLTGYGYDVLRETTATGATPTAAALTTGHATTTVAVVKTVHAALAATGRDLGELTLAVVGCGSIGTSSLRLLLARSPHPPARLLLCDLPGSAPRLHDLAAELSAGCPQTPVQVVEAEDARTLPRRDLPDSRRRRRSGQRQHDDPGGREPAAARHDRRGRLLPALLRHGASLAPYA
ncbi:hypothetical protein [Streptomyces sp. AK04-3B]|uniref:hypothetical protein n=1 Tax=Streptomyces sp. AK04-3B TaxID=3028650 RepID=UPI0039F58E72